MILSKIFLNLISIIIGLVFGSFINVIIYRFPKNLSVLKPRSFCTECNKKIPWYENIPILSWLIMKGKCSKCNAAISIRYPTIELFTGILFLIAQNSIPNDINIGNYIFTLLKSWGMIIILLPLSIIDYYFLWIPNSLIKTGIIFGFLISIFSSIINDQNLFLTLFANIISGLLGFFMIIMIMKFGEIIFKKPSMGMGDAKLAGTLGLWLGFPAILVLIWTSFLLAGLYITFEFFCKRIYKGQLIPFGPFLSLSGILIYFYGEDIFLKLLIS